MRLPESDSMSNKNTHQINRIRITDDYADAVKDYLDHETLHIFTIKKKKANSKFYENITDTFYENKNFRIVKNVQISEKTNEAYIPRNYILSLSNRETIKNPLKRCNYLMNKIKINHLDAKQQEELKKLFIEYSEAF